jgi:hypothetical protein
VSPRTPDARVARLSSARSDALEWNHLFLATEGERRVLARACDPDQRIVLFEVDIPDQPRPPVSTYNRAGRVR